MRLEPPYKRYAEMLVGGARLVGAEDNLASVAKESVVQACLVDPSSHQSGKVMFQMTEDGDVITEVGDV